MNTLELCRQIISNKALLVKILDNAGKSGKVTIGKDCVVKAKADKCDTEYTNPLDLLELLYSTTYEACNHTINVGSEIASILATIVESGEEEALIKCIISEIGAVSILKMPKLAVIDIHISTLVDKDCAKEDKKTEDKKTEDKKTEDKKTEDKKVENTEYISLLCKVDDSSYNSLWRAITSNDTVIIDNNNIGFEVETYEEPMNTQLALHGKAYGLVKNGIEYQTINNTIITKDYVYLFVEGENTVVYKAKAYVLGHSKVEYETCKYCIIHRDKYVGTVGEPICHALNSQIGSRTYLVGDLIGYSYNGVSYEGLIVLNVDRVGVLNLKDQTIVSLSDIDNIECIIRSGKDIHGEIGLGEHTRMTKIK